MPLLKIGFAGITGLVIAQGLKKVSIGHLLTKSVPRAAIFRVELGGET